MLVANIKKKYREVDHGFDETLKPFKKGKSKTVNIGIVSSSPQEHTGRGEGKKSSLSMADIAALHEFGGKKKSKTGKQIIPERPFMSQTMSKNDKAISKKIILLYKKVLDGDLTEDKALGLLGEFVKGKMKSEITTGDFKENAASTIAKKGSSRPLVDTSQLLNSIDWELDE